jgi:nucleotidyltransferase/DNA polymerase involved in DNA repair
VVVREEELPEFLASRPVGALPVGEGVVRRLERLGVETLGALARLPEPALVAQFGGNGRRALAWATGRRIDPVRPLSRPRPIRVAFELPAPVGQVETLHGALDRLLERALSRPARRGRSVAGVRLTARLEEEGSWTVEHVLKEPTSTRAELARTMRARIALAPPARAVEALQLEFFRFGPASHQSDLFDRAEASGRAAPGSELAEGEVPPSLRDAVKELKLRLGYSPLYRVVEVDPWSRIPERRHALLSFDP